MTTPRPDVRDRSGIALVTALLAMVLIGILVTGALYFSTQEYRVGRNMLGQERALAVAEFGANELLRNWDTTLSTTMNTGDVTTRTYSPTGGGVDTVTVTRLNNNLYWLVSVGTVGSGDALARRRTNMFLHAVGSSFSAGGAITTKLTAKLTTSGSAYASGVNANPTNWSACPAVNDTVPGIRAPDTTTALWTYSSSNPTKGNPPVQETSVAADTMTYTTFGGKTYAQLAAMADKVYTGNASSIAPTLTGGVCNTAQMSNWGEPWHSPTAGAVTACNNYFPIIYATGNFQFSGGRGQGIILVDGNFTASGGTEFVGLIVVKGAFTTSGGGIKLYGALYSRGMTGNQSTMSGSTVINYSSCALSALSGILGGGGKMVTPVRQRAWSDFILTQ